MIIECSYCDSKVDAAPKGEMESFDGEWDLPLKTTLLQCPVCENALLGGSEQVRTGPETYIWTDIRRLWPKQETDLDLEIPRIARNSLVEAKICFKAKAYSACAVMCGRTIEGVCKHHSTKSRTLAAGLKELKEKGIIDSRLFEWGDVLRNHRNIGAHATEEKISKEDAKDLLDFSSAICEYVFVLNAKFNRFKERQKKPNK